MIVAAGSGRTAESSSATRSPMSSKHRWLTDLLMTRRHSGVNLDVSRGGRQRGAQGLHAAARWRSIFFCGCERSPVGVGEPLPQCSDYLRAEVAVW